MGSELARSISNVALPTQIYEVIKYIGPNDMAYCTVQPVRI